MEDPGVGVASRLACGVGSVANRLEKRETRSGKVDFSRLVPEELGKEEARNRKLIFLLAGREDVDNLDVRRECLFDERDRCR